MTKTNDLLGRVEAALDAREARIRAEAFAPLDELEALKSEYSDTFKEAHGFRPRLPDASVETYRELVAEAHRDAADAFEERSKAEQAAVQVFEAHLTKLVEMGASCRAVALRWTFEAEGETECLRGRDAVEWAWGLPRGYLRPED